VSDRSAQIAAAGGFNLLSDGLVSFRHCAASSYEQTRLDADRQNANRKERARVLSRLLDLDAAASEAQPKGGNRAANSSNGGGILPPPPKGATLVVSIPSSDVGCAKLRRVLFLLATYYNLFVILVVPPSSTEINRVEAVAKLRGSGSQHPAAPDDDDDGSLSLDVLPDHRVVAASTTAGRVAFVRQLQRVELMLDFDPEVKGLLTRFGHKVVLYGQGAASPASARAAGSSRLGCALQL
jgi:hypothetical protein